MADVPRLLRLRDVVAMTGLPRSSIYAEMSAGRFPRPMKVLARAVAWRSDEVEAWIKQKIKENRNG